MVNRNIADCTFWCKGAIPVDFRYLPERPTAGFTPPSTEPERARTTFRRLRQASEDLRANGQPIGPALSMGMSDDYPIAVEEGATIVRVGRALFGERHDHDHGPGHEHAHPAP